MSSNVIDFIKAADDDAEECRQLLDDVVAAMRVCMAELAETKQKLAKSEDKLIKTTVELKELKEHIERAFEERNTRNKQRDEEREVRDKDIARVRAEIAEMGLINH